MKLRVPINFCDGNSYQQGLSLLHFQMQRWSKSVKKVITHSRSMGIHKSLVRLGIVVGIFQNKKVYVIKQSQICLVQFSRLTNNIHTYNRTNFRFYNINVLIGRFCHIKNHVFSEFKISTLCHFPRFCLMRRFITAESGFLDNKLQNNIIGR